ncbi:MAG: hypothetical protein Q7R95_06100 [bacterium]|nr:hypothetical protein [bacterium]
MKLTRKSKNVFIDEDTKTSYLIYRNSATKAQARKMIEENIEWFLHKHFYGKKQRVINHQKDSSGNWVF